MLDKIRAGDTVYLDGQRAGVLDVGRNVVSLVMADNRRVTADIANFAILYRQKRYDAGYGFNGTVVQKQEMKP